MHITFAGGGLGRGFFPNETQDSVLKKPHVCFLVRDTESCFFLRQVVGD